MTGVLLLNATFEPLKVISTKRAIVLLLSEKAEILEEKDMIWHSENEEFSVPSVIRLTRYVQIPYRGTLPMNRKNLIVRDKGNCAYCLKHVSSEDSTIDHVQPRSRGGKNVWENVVLACRKCNSKKSDSLLSEIGWALPFTPHAPKGTFWLLIGEKADPDWEPYLVGAQAAAA